MVSTVGNCRITRTAAQNKEETGEAVDSIGELVAICERDGFIPKFYVDQPNDKVDKVIKDMQHYTHDLVTEELGLENLIENSVKSLQRERERIQAAANDVGDSEQQEEEELFNYDVPFLSDQDLIDFRDEEEEETEENNE